MSRRFFFIKSGILFVGFREQVYSARLIRIAFWTVATTALAVWWSLT